VKPGVALTDVGGRGRVGGNEGTITSKKLRGSWTSKADGTHIFLACPVEEKKVVRVRKDLSEGERGSQQSRERHLEKRCQTGSFKIKGFFKGPAQPFRGGKGMGRKKRNE